MTLPLVAGFPTHVVRRGSTARRAVFIHCTMAHAGAWSGVQAELAGKLAMTAFDRPGHGSSAPVPDAGGAVELLDLTTRIAAALAPGPTDIIGHSFGAIVALRLAMTRPELVRSLVLIEPPLFAAIAATPEGRAQTAAMTEVRAALSAGEAARAARLFHEAVNPENPWPELSEIARESLTRQVSLAAIEAPVTRDDAAGLLAPGGLEAITAPVLLLQGSHSPPVFAETVAALAGRLPDARRAMVRGAGHMLPLTHPVAVAGEIAGFLKL